MVSIWSRFSLQILGKLRSPTKKLTVGGSHSRDLPKTLATEHTEGAERFEDSKISLFGLCWQIDQMFGYRTRSFIRDQLFSALPLRQAASPLMECSCNRDALYAYDRRVVFKRSLGLRRKVSFEQKFSNPKTAALSDALLFPPVFISSCFPRVPFRVSDFGKCDRSRFETGSYLAILLACSLLCLPLSRVSMAARLAEREREREL